MTKLPIELAQDQLVALVDSLGEGEVVILTRDEQPVAKLVRQAHDQCPLAEPRSPGSAPGSVVYMADDFDSPLADFADHMP